MFTDGKPFTVTAEDMKRRWGGGFWCKLCGKDFSEGDVIRWIYANGTPGCGTGNFMVCASCDGDNVEVIERAKASLALAMKYAKQWRLIDK